jgi:hypothetical protein
MLKKLIYKPKIGIPRAKWLEKLELKKKLKVTIKFTKRNIDNSF